MNRTFYVYIMASFSGVLYVGFTNHLQERVRQHKSGEGGYFTSKYRCQKLVYFKEHKYVLNALEREKQLKRWRREKKKDLIQSINPDWKDLAEEWENNVI